MNNFIKKYFAIVKIIWLSLVIIFIGFYLYRNYKHIIDIFSMLSGVNIVLTCIFLIVSKFFLAGNMYLSLIYSNERVPFLKCFNIYNITQLAKYIPGGIWHFVGRIGMYNKEGIKTAIIKRSMILEIIWLLLGAFFIGISLVVLTKPLFIAKILYKYFHLLVICGIIGLIISVLIIFLKFKTINSGVKNFFSKPKFFSKVIIFQLMIWLFLGLSFVSIIIPFIPNHSLFLYLIGLYALAYIIGFVVPFAPAGLGIREGILILGLSFVFNIDTSLALTGIHRVFYVIIEIMLIPAGHFIGFFQKITKR